MTTDPASLGFILPADQDWISEGDDAISENARVTARLLDGKAEATALATKADQSTVDGLATDLTTKASIEYVDSGLDAAAAHAEQIVRNIVDTSHIALDVDGTPYFQPGSMSLRLLQDIDGNPYFQETS